MKDQATTAADVPAVECSLHRSVRQIPAFFAGRLYVEEDVQGGTGATPDEAVEDYFANHADDEVDYVDDEESGEFTVEIYAVHEPTPEDDGVNPEWDWELGRCVEKRVFNWHREPDPEWPGLERIVYSPNSVLNEPGSE